MSFQRYRTVQDLVGDVMQALGLPAPVSVVGSTDKTALQLLALANEAGLELVGEHAWEMLSRTYEITTVPAQAAYDLPEDFDRFEADSQWNQTTRLPAVGPLASYEWEMLRARQVSGTTFTMLFRMEEDQVVFYETPSEVQTIAMPYIGKGWVRSNDGQTYRDQIEASDDFVLFDEVLFKMALKLKFREAKGFDTTADAINFNRNLEKAKAKDTPGRTLSLGQSGSFPYLGYINIPDTGYGGG